MMRSCPSCSPGLKNTVKLGQHINPSQKYIESFGVLKNSSIENRPTKLSYFIEIEKTFKIRTKNAFDRNYLDFQPFFLLLTQKIMANFGKQL